ncbi:MAG: CapA family protein [Pseudomonadota bacterium]
MNAFRCPRRLALTGFLCFIAACSGTPPIPSAPPAAESTPVQQPEAPPEAAPRRQEPPRPDITLSIAAVGDMMLGTDYPENRLPDDDGRGFLAHVAPVLRAADVALGNLEGVLSDGAEPRKRCTNLSACYLFRSPTRYAAHFRDAGFDALSLANNHARDFGEEGRSDTMLALSDYDIAHSGRVDDFATLQHSGLSISFIAFAVTQNSNLVHDYPLAERIVREQAQKHDLVIVSFHAGAEGQGVTRIPFAEEEYFGEPRGDVVRFGRGMVDAGADLVFGHGPHVVRAMERYKDRLIAYSLGNFATYYGISVADIKGIAPILVATIDSYGRFISGKIHSTVQVRPGGPRPDPEQRALKLIEELSMADFGTPGLRFLADGSIAKDERAQVRRSAAPLAR